VNCLDEAVRPTSRFQVRPSWTEGRWYLGTILYSQERFEEARDAFRRVVAASPEDARAWAFKGLCEFELRGYDRALSDLQRAQVLGIPGKEVYHVATYHYGILLTRYEQFEESMQYLSKLAREGNESTSIAEALGLSALRIPLLPSELPPQKREMVLMAGRATVHWANARRPAARAGYEELILRARRRRTPTTPSASSSWKRGRRRGPCEFNRELRISPPHVEAMLQIALEKNLRAEHEEVLALAQKAVEIAPRNLPGGTLPHPAQPGRRGRCDPATEEGARLALSREMHFELARLRASGPQGGRRTRAGDLQEARGRDEARSERRPAGERGGRARLEREAA
jgi:tetratricopeptide (TPR) repeat protein